MKKKIILFVFFLS